MKQSQFTEPEPNQENSKPYFQLLIEAIDEKNRSAIAASGRHKNPAAIQTKLGIHDRVLNIPVEHSPIDSKENKVNT